MRASVKQVESMFIRAQCITITAALFASAIHSLLHSTLAQCNFAIFTCSHGWVSHWIEHAAYTASLHRRDRPTRMTMVVKRVNNGCKAVCMCTEERTIAAGGRLDWNFARTTPPLPWGRITLPHIQRKLVPCFFVRAL